MKCLKVVVALCLGGALLCGAATADPIITGSGGNGQPLTLTIEQPITFTLTSAGSSFNFDIEFQDVFSSYDFNSYLVSSGPTLGTTRATPLTAGGSGQSLFVQFLGAEPLVYQVGDTMTLNAGTLVISQAVDTPLFFGPTTLTLYSDGGAALASTDVEFLPEGVPEPGTWALALAGMGLLGRGVLRRRALAA